MKKETNRELTLRVLVVEIATEKRLAVPASVRDKAREAKAALEARKLTPEVLKDLRRLAHPEAANTVAGALMLGQATATGEATGNYNVHL